jgi:hypothetical protein
MEYMYEPKEMNRVLEARESFSGRLLSDAQFDEAMAITGIVEREIRKSGAFKEKLGDYAYAFSRTEKFDPLKAETILRDLFKARTGQTMNQMREGFAERESKLTRAQTGQAYDHAIAVGKMIEEGNKISFHRAFNHQATQLAGQLGITDAGAKRLMKEEFKTAEADLDFYEWGKDIEERFYKPQIEREKEQRERGQERDNGRERSRARDRNDDERSDQRAEPSEREPARREASRSRSRMEYRR